MKDYNERDKMYGAIRDGIGYAFCAYFIILAVLGVIGIILSYIFICFIMRRIYNGLYY